MSNVTLAVGEKPARVRPARGGASIAVNRATRRSAGAAATEKKPRRKAPARKKPLQGAASQ